MSLPSDVQRDALPSSDDSTTRSGNTAMNRLHKAVVFDHVHGLLNCGGGETLGMGADRRS